MKITEKLRQEPYNYTADIEYYKKGYRGLIGVPGRVLQAKELSSLSMYPIYAMNDIASAIFSEGIVNGMEYSDDAKMSAGSVSGMTMEEDGILEKMSIIDKNENEETIRSVSYNEKELESSGILGNYYGEEKEPETEKWQNAITEESVSENETKTNDEEYTVTVYNDAGEEGWPKNII